MNAQGQIPREVKGVGEANRDCAVIFSILLCDYEVTYANKEIDLTR